MFILLLSLCLLLLLSVLYSLTNLYSVHRQAFKEWWFARHCAYPASRHQFPHCLHTLLDSFFALDRPLYDLQHTPKQIHVIKATLYAVDECAPLCTESVQLGWSRDETSAELYAGEDLCLLEAAVQRKHIVTSALRQLVGVSDQITLSVPDLIPTEYDVECSYFLVVDYMTASSRGQVYRVVLGDEAVNMVFPTTPASVPALTGLKQRRVLSALLNGTDVTELVQQLCGPENNFGELDYPRLWFGLVREVSGLERQRNTLEIEDTRGGLHVW